MPPRLISCKRYDLSDYSSKRDFKIAREVQFGMLDSELATAGQSTHPGRLRVNSRVPLELSPIRTEPHFWGLLPVGGHPGATRLAALTLFTEALNGVSPVRVPKTVIDCVPEPITLWAPLGQHHDLSTRFVLLHAAMRFNDLVKVKDFADLDMQCARCDLLDQNL